MSRMPLPAWERSPLPWSIWPEEKIDLQLESKDKDAERFGESPIIPRDFGSDCPGAVEAWLHFWKGDANHEFFKLKLESDGRGMSLSPDHTQVAVAHADSCLRTYRLFQS